MNFKFQFVVPINLKNDCNGINDQIMVMIDDMIVSYQSRDVRTAMNYNIVVILLYLVVLISFIVWFLHNGRL